MEDATPYFIQLFIHWVFCKAYAVHFPFVSHSILMLLQAIFPWIESFDMTSDIVSEVLFKLLSDCLEPDLPQFFHNYVAYYARDDSPK